MGYLAHRGRCGPVGRFDLPHEVKTFASWFVGVTGVAILGLFLVDPNGPKILTGILNVITLTIQDAFSVIRGA